MAEDDELVRQVLAYSGKLARPPYTARYPVNTAMIQHWTDALGDRNPAYPTVAPAAMLTIWTMPGLDPSPPDPGPLDKLIVLLTSSGITGVVATNLTQEFIRALLPDEIVTVSSVIEGIVGPKQTALGTGFFLDLRQEVTVGSGELVGTSTMRILRYRPAQSSSASGRRPRPVADQDTSFFWEGVASHELRIQRCGACGAVRHPPRPMCSRCNSLDWDWIVSNGRGSVYSFVVHHAPPMPGMTVPFVVALIELEEGTRLISNLVGVDPAEVCIGMRVAVSFEMVEGDLMLPLFRPVRLGSPSP